MHISGKIVAATLFSVVLLGFATWKVLPQYVGFGKESMSVSSASETSVYTADTDADGVKDWEEILLGLNPDNPDSNGDGISDGEAVAQARKAFEENTNAQIINASTTQTDLLAREIFGAYIQSKQQDAFDTESFDFIIAQATNSQFANSYNEQHVLDDLNISADTSAESARAYETAFQQALLTVTEIGEYELATYGRAIETGNEAEFQKLATAAGIYDQIAEDLLKITVPKDGAQELLDLVNSFKRFADVLRTMTTTPEDPILSFVATRDFIEAEDAIKIAYSQIDIYFTLRGDEL